MRTLAYVYPGWHPVAERDASFHPGFTEWELVYDCRPRFAGHAQPRLPLWGRYDDRDPLAVGRRVALAASAGLDGFVYGLFWHRGKRVFEDALDLGFLGAAEGQRFPFAVMWANRMPRRVLPVARPDDEVIDAARRVSSDVDDFVALVTMLGERYFARPNYVHVAGRPYFSIFDTSFFLRELGLDGAARAIAAAQQRLRALGLPPMHLGAVEPASDHVDALRALGFTSVTHYVSLPVWKGPLLQDFAHEALARAADWPRLAERSGLPYLPSVSPGWDASPRGADFGPARPSKYPWSPVITGESPPRFAEALRRAYDFARPAAEPLVMVASWNEWSEGHYLEPDERHGHGWLEALASARATGTAR